MISARALGVLMFGGCIGAAVLMACSDDELDPNPGASSSGTSGAPSEAGASKEDSGSSGGQDAGGNVVNGCRTFEDRRADDAERIIPWDFVISTAPERCLQVKVGQKVVWGTADKGVRASFGDHPVVVKGGSTPNPIDGISAAGEVTFGSEGTFGYQCGIHTGIMIGAILVSP